MRELRKYCSRREFIQGGASIVGVTAGLLAVPRPTLAMLGSKPEQVPSIRDSRIKMLVQRALDAAQSAGAVFADVRLDNTKNRTDWPTVAGIVESETLYVGVRALVNGYWGFASSSVWSPGEMVRLAKEATSQARINSLGKPRDLFLAPITPIIDKHWETPVRIDITAVHPLEIRDFLEGLVEKIRVEFGVLNPNGYVNVGSIGVKLKFRVQEKAYGSSDGTYCTQRLHRSEGEVTGGAKSNVGEIFASANEILTIQGVGWELFKEGPIIDTFRRNIQHSTEMAKLPIKPIEVGRFDAVLDAHSVAKLISKTIGAATEIDRVLGYEANAGGTSYINNPDEAIDKLKIGASQLTVNANRSEVGGVATVGWDDDGVQPTDFTIVKGGILNDFSTSREGTGWLQQTYTKTSRPVRSNGCAYTDLSSNIPLIHTPNLTMTPGVEALSQKDLETGVEKGIVIVGMDPLTDFQCAGGVGTRMECYELKAGKRVARYTSAEFLFRTSELWNNLMAIGGATSAARFGIGTGKGEPNQTGYHSVTAVPAVVKDLSFVDGERR